MIIKGIKHMCYVFQRQQLELVLESGERKYVDMSVLEYDRMLKTGDFKILEQYV